MQELPVSPGHAQSKRLCGQVGLVAGGSILLLASLVSGGFAQTIQGYVVDVQAAQAVPQASVELVDSQDRGLSKALTDSAGFFAIRAWRSGEYRLRIERFGYHGLTTTAVALQRGETVTVRIEISVEPVDLGPIKVEARSVQSLSDGGLRAFNERMRWGRLLGLGRFLDADEINKRVATTVEDLLRSIEGVRVVRIPVALAVP